MLKHVFGRVIIEIDKEGKNWHTFSSGQKIRLERQYENLNRRETEPVNAIVVSGENIPNGSEILVHPNSATPPHQIHNYTPLSGKETSSDIKYYSIPEEQCFIWEDENGNWCPLSPYETALRVYEPYTGILVGIEPKLIKNTLYCTSGKLKGQVVATIKAVDYEIVFMDSNGQEGRIIRFRPFGCKKTGREAEAVAGMHNLTELVNEGKLFVGLSPSTAKPLKELINV